MKGAAALAAIAVMFYVSAFDVMAATGKVTADTAKIRAQASTDSDVVGSTTKGQKIDILEAVKDSAGTVWYKVSVTGGYGYIRSDLVETSESIEAVSATTQQTSQQTTSTEQPPETVPTSIGEQAATISTDGSAKIRSGASTSHSVVTSLPKGTNITLIGEANDNAGNKWYQLTCSYNGRTVEGYVRSDLITIGAAAEDGENPEAGAEGEPAEGEYPQEGEGSEGGEEEETGSDAEPEHRDYEVVYTQNESGEYEYYLYDNVNGNRQKLGELLSAVPTANEKIMELAGQVDKGKIIIIILAVVVVLLFIVITVLLLKIRSLYYDDYEYEDDEEEEPEPEPVKKTRRRPLEEEREPVRKKRTSASESSQQRERSERSGERSGKVRRESGREAELYAAQERPVKKQPSRKAQNFLVDDDEFEFEFLNMDDKDL